MRGAVCSVHCFADFLGSFVRGAICSAHRCTNFLCGPVQLASCHLGPPKRTKPSYTRHMQIVNERCEPLSPTRNRSRLALMYCSVELGGSGARHSFRKPENQADIFLRLDGPSIQKGWVVSPLAHGGKRSWEKRRRPV